MNLTIYSLVCLVSVITIAKCSSTTAPDESTNQAEIEPGLEEHLSKYPRANIIVSFVGGTEEVLRTFNSKLYRTHGTRLEALTQALEDYTFYQQETTRDFLESDGIEYESYWISNQIFVPKANKQLVSDIASYPQVMKIEKEKHFRVNPIIVASPATSTAKPRNYFSTSVKKEEIQWSISRIQVPEAWKLTNGSGVVVATIDSGARSTHETLKSNFRAKYGWYDAYKKLPQPYDDTGHGSHVLGSIVGTNGYGVAPGAQWITCKGCHEKICKMSQLLACGQWIICPSESDGSDRNCTYAPRIVSNSWTGKSTDDSFSSVINAWRKGGIIPVFSIGNAGPNCSTAGSPGNNPQVIGVGSLDSLNRLSYFSSRGPSKQLVKPDIVAFGSGIKSASNKGDNEYNTLSGTSMAAPHIAGVLALLLSLEPQMTFEEAWYVLRNSTDTDVDISEMDKCRNSTGEKTIPNNLIGYGKVNAHKAVKLVIS